MNNGSGISSRLKLLRKQKNLTQTELANAIGIGQTAIANYETGKRFPDENNLIRIADYFEISLDKLIGREIRTLHSKMQDFTGFRYIPSELGNLTEDFMHKAKTSGTDALNMITRLLHEGYTEEQILIDLLEASLLRTGDLWAEGRYNEAMEHQLSMTVVQSILGMMTLSSPVKKFRGKFAALTASGEQHNIGLRMLSRFLEIDGWESFFLGTSVPAVSLVDFLKSNRIELVCISATLNENTDSLCSMIKAVKSSSSSIIMAGGRATSLNKKRILDSGADYIFSSVSETIEITRKLRTAKSNAVQGEKND